MLYRNLDLSVSIALSFLFGSVSCHWIGILLNLFPNLDVELHMMLVQVLGWLSQVLAYAI